MRNLTILSFLFLFTACASETPENVGQRVNQLIGQNNYEQALEILEDSDAEETDADLELLREKVHLNYGIFLEYEGEEGMGMRRRMTGALRQYILVLEINPNNQKARAEINQIMGIYATMPNSPPEDILEDLNRLGFE